jgi:hypothetical protein
VGDSLSYGNFVSRCLARGLLGFVILALLSACSGPAEVRYRLEVTIEVDGVTTTAASVYQMTLRSGGGSGAGTIARFLVSPFKGQAIVLPLVNRPTLIVAMRVGSVDGFTTLYLSACDLQPKEGEAASTYLGRVQSFNGRCSVEPKFLTILAIADPLDPRSLRLARVSNLAGTFGPGVSLVSAALVTTDEPISTGIRSIFPWVQEPGVVVMPSDNIYRQIDTGIPLLNDMFLLGKDS